MKEEKLNRILENQILIMDMVESIRSFTISSDYTLQQVAKAVKETKLLINSSK